MASPPFSLATTTPADNDIVSQFPSAERTFRDEVNSWIRWDHNTAGGHNMVSFAPQSPDPTFAAGVVGVWAIADGTIKSAVGSGTPIVLGVPPGAYMPYFGTTAPAGWFLMYGQAVSRATYAALFTAIGTVGGVGDGVSTFNIPDMRGLMSFGKTDMGGVDAANVTTAGSNIDGKTLGATGGFQNVILDASGIPAHAHASPALTDPQHQHLVFNADITGVGGTLTSGNFASVQRNSGTSSFNDYIMVGTATSPTIGRTTSASTGITIAATTGSIGSTGPHTNMPPSRSANFIMKY